MKRPPHALKRNFLGRGLWRGAIYGADWKVRQGSMVKRETWMSCRPCSANCRLNVRSPLFRWGRSLALRVVPYIVIYLTLVLPSARQSHLRDLLRLRCLHIFEAQWKRTARTAKLRRWGSGLGSPFLIPISELLAWVMSLRATIISYLRKLALNRNVLTKHGNGTFGSRHILVVMAAIPADGSKERQALNCHIIVTNVWGETERWCMVLPSILFLSLFRCFIFLNFLHL